MDASALFYKEDALMKVYLAGPITGVKDYAVTFNYYEEEFQALGCCVMNPAVLPEGFEHNQYMEICYKMIDACDMVVLLPGFADSKGACLELMYAIDEGKMTLIVGSLNFMPEAFWDSTHRGRTP